MENFVHFGFVGTVKCPQLLLPQNFPSCCIPSYRSLQYHHHILLIILIHGITLTPLDQVYDPNGDGQIDEGELKDIIISCVAENGMEFDEQQVILGRHDTCQTFTRAEVLGPKFYTNINS